MSNTGLYNSVLQQQRYQFNGWVPYYNTTNGLISLEATNIFKNDFSRHYRAFCGTEWCPMRSAIAKPPLLIQTQPIYYTNMGFMPNYSGHIPGKRQRHGRTFGNDTKDAKYWFEQPNF